MGLRWRTYRGEADYWAVRELLCCSFLAQGGGAHSRWHVGRFDYWYHHLQPIMVPLPLSRSVFLWETPQGRIVAVLHPEAMGEIVLQMDARWRTLGLEQEMLAVAEEFLAVLTPQGGRRLRVWADEQDPLRRRCLLLRGYQSLPGEVYCWERSLQRPVGIPEVPRGYRIRPLDWRCELPQRAFVSWKAFHPDIPDEHYHAAPDGNWYHNLQQSPTYRHDLDLVVGDSAGVMVGFATVWWDPLTRSGLFEPVGVHPEHQGRGLGRALMSEGLRRLQSLGAVHACLCSHRTPATDRLYASAGFSISAQLVRWERSL